VFIKNPTSRVLDLWEQWTTIVTKFDLHETLEDPKGKKQEAIARADYQEA
jgi:hypothetical protein